MNKVRNNEWVYNGRSVIQERSMLIISSFIKQQITKELSSLLEIFYVIQYLYIAANKVLLNKTYYSLYKYCY